MAWQNEHIGKRKDPRGTMYVCRVCGHTERNFDKSSRAWGRIRAHVNGAHPEWRTINGRPRFQTGGKS